MRASSEARSKEGRATRLLLLSFAFFCGACKDEVPCVASVSEGLRPEARYALGDAHAYPRHDALDEGELYRSFAERRRLGWSVIARATEAVPAERANGTVARFQTWYDRDDLRRVVRYLRRLSVERTGVDTLEGVSEADLDAAFAWNRTSVRELESWPEERLADYIDAAEGEDQVHGLGGISRNLYDPIAARHLVRSAARIAACDVPGHDELPPELSAETRSLFVDGCGAVSLGRFALVRDEVLVLQIEDTSAVLQGPGCVDGRCELRGPAEGEYTLEATGRGRVAVRVERRAPNGLSAPCLVGDFPAGAAVAKTQYRREGLGVELHAFDTDARTLSELPSEGWGEGREPSGTEGLYRVELPNGDRYRLVGLHVMTKELPHWVWASAWWSDRPNKDFGADRPTESTAFSAYKMCVVTDFLEGDDTLAGVEASLRAANEARPYAASMCSNPYIETGDGNATTNCIGCHQHAGLAIRSEDILRGEFEGAFREAPGRFVERANFPTDYVFTANVMRALLDEDI